MARRGRLRAADDAARTQKEKRELEFSYAAEVEGIARELIPRYHDHLVNVRIEYVFRSVATKKDGKLVLAKARKVGGLNAFLADTGGMTGDPFFVVEAAAEEWKGLNEKQRQAVIDHELCHCWRDEDTGKLSILPHDVEEFAAVVRRHGLVMADMKRFAKATYTQLSLIAGDDGVHE